MSTLSAIAGVALILIVLGDAFETIILPRRVTRQIRLARFFFRYTWRPWSALVVSIFSGKRQETYLSFYGPFSLLLLLIIWATGLIFGFALLLSATGSAVHSSGATPGFATDLYLSGTTFFTLGLGDVTPVSTTARVLTAMEAGLGFGFLAMVIGYLPAITQSFSRREVNISLLDARAGSPPTACEMLRRNSVDHRLKELQQLLRDWEGWSAELLESHLSYPVLAYFRSQHDNQSWLGALTVVLDTCALILARYGGRRLCEAGGVVFCHRPPRPRGPLFDLQKPSPGAGPRTSFVGSAGRFMFRGGERGSSSFQGTRCGRKAHRASAPL